MDRTVVKSNLGGCGCKVLNVASLYLFSRWSYKRKHRDRSLDEIEEALE